MLQLTYTFINFKGLKMNTSICNASLQIGSILMALENFKDLKHKVNFYKKKFTHELSEAKKDYQSFGMFEDCGSHYEEKINLVESKYNTLIFQFQNQMIRKEKYYRKLRHQFIIDFPSYTQTLNNMIVQKNIEIAQYHRNKNQ